MSHLSLLDYNRYIVGLNKQHYRIKESTLDIRISKHGLLESLICNLRISMETKSTALVTDCTPLNIDHVIDSVKTEPYKIKEYIATKWVIKQRLKS